MNSAYQLRHDGSTFLSVHTGQTGWPLLGRGWRLTFSAMAEYVWGRGGGGEGGGGGGGGRGEASPSYNFLQIHYIIH